MKYTKILAAALCLCMTAPMATVQVGNTYALTLANDTATLISDNFVYKNYGDYIEITAIMTNSEGDIEVPAEINGVPVTAIAEHGLAGASKVTSILLPETIRTIGKQAFAYNTALQKINIPDGVAEIPDEAFLNCKSLKYLYIPQSVTSIGVRAFYSCNFTKVNIPDSVNNISEMAFADCQSLTDINIPACVTKLESNVFSNCFALESLVIPENVTFISKGALPMKIKNLTIINPDCELEDGMHLYITRDCVITAPEGSKAQEFAEAYEFTFEVYNGDCESDFIGDVNSDGSFTIADVVAMQKYLIDNGNLKQPQNGDMDGDGRLDVFDYVLMLKELRKEPIYNPPIEPPVSYNTVNLTADIKPSEIALTELDRDFTLSQTDFALELFKNNLSAEKNTLVSPYSVMQALAMTANGADGATKIEMENVLGSPMNTLNSSLYTLRTSQGNTEKSRLSTANSIWARSGCDVSQDFLQKNVSFYNADFFTAPFDDSTLTDINNWVNDKTNEMIPEILDEIAQNAVMYLVNAVAFEAEWETEFNEDTTVKADFTKFDGGTQTVDMMQSYDGAYYLKDDNAEGIYKYYSGRKYAFVAMLPDEGVSVNDYIAGLSAESFNGLLTDSGKEHAGVNMPKFSYDFDTELSGILSDMGMPSAFDRNAADFSNMITNLDGPTYISRVIHKTHIDVDEGGTKAAAATGVEMTNDVAPAMPEHIVTFNRPFAYFIIDTETNIPVFMGTLMTSEN